MGVYIKSMEMPKSCLSCPLQGGTADCRLTQKTYNWGLPERPSDCPLVPATPHGRLIDADEFLNVERLTIEEALASIESGEILDAKTQIGILRWVREQGK